jgi:hypothetical protein
MTLKNNTAVPRDYSLIRYADIDANNADGGDFKNWFDFEHDSAWGYNPGFNTYGLMMTAVPTNSASHFTFVQNTSKGPDPCAPVNNLPSTPFFGDGSAGVDFNGTLGAGKAVTVSAEYRAF